MYKVYPYNHLYRTDEKQLVTRLLDEMGDVEITTATKLYNDRSMLNTLMRWFPLGSPKGDLLMSIAESILRIPDNRTRNALVAQLHIPLPDSLVRGFVLIAVRYLARSLISAETIQGAYKPGKLDSYDMLGESAVTFGQAERYFGKYREAAWAVNAPGEISIKLSSLYPRYEYLKQDFCVGELIAKVQRLANICDSRGVSLTIDAEESDRLDLSMRVIECVSCTNLVVAVQAYQKRALGVLKHLNDLGQPLGIRLVKGAYWDTEIKMAQERGLEYPVFTSKENTNISYLACAKYLLESENLTPKFATHNPSTVAAVLSLTGEKLEFQRLYGMGNKLHKAIKKQGHTSRTYKPVGSATDLLAYLIRRMMENGANSSFVMHNQPEDHRTPGEPRDSYTKMYDRPNSPGLDTSDPESLNRLRRHINENSNP